MIKEEKYEKYNWDLEDLLKGKSLDDLINQWKKGIEKLTKMYDGIFDSYENFKNWLNFNEEFRIISNRLNNYISNKSNEDISEQKWIGVSQSLKKISNDYAVKTSDYENRIYKNEKKIYEYLKNSEISEYKRSFDNVIKFKSHNLSDESENLLSKLSIADGGVEEMYSTLIDSEIKFDDAIDKNNKKHKIEKHSDVMINLKSLDRTLRKNSWISFNKAFYDFKTTLTYSLYYNYLGLNTYAKIRNFDNYIASTCFSDEIDIKLIPHIYEQVKKYKVINHTFNEHRKKLIKKLLNLKEIEPWDTNVDLVKLKCRFEIEEAKKIVMDALAPMGKEYLSIIKKAFDEKWISWLPRKNKYSGAYSIGGTKGLDKFYILMNYDKTLNSVFTIIHELGHSLNSYFYSKTQKVYASITIFCAEIASITNEMLLNYYLLDKYKNNHDMHCFVLDELLSGFFATTTRQVIFSNFEWKINELINDSKPITYDVISKTYLETMQEYIVINDPKKYEKEPFKYSLVTPLRIPHFYAGNFYVYKYSIGQVVGCIVAKRIIDNEPGFLEKYLKFLSLGTSVKPIDAIKILDIDLYSSKPWLEAGEIIGDFVKKYQKIS